MKPATPWLQHALRAQILKVDDGLRTLIVARDQAASSWVQRLAAERQRRRFLDDWRQLKEFYALDPVLVDG